MEERVNLRYLQKEGFKKDATAPEKVNRWEKTDGKKTDNIHIENRTYFVSVTLTEDGSQALYGIVNFYGDYGYINQHRYFNGGVSVDEFKKFIDKNEQELPPCIKIFPKK